MSSVPRMSRSRWLMVLLGLTGVYFLAGKLGLFLAFEHSSASPVWPPTGIAIAAILWFGPGIWPAIALGAFLVNVTTPLPVATPLMERCLLSGAIAAGNCLEGLLAGLLVRRFAGGRDFWMRPADLGRFALAAGLLAPAVSASVGVGSLALAGQLSAVAAGMVWLTWWLGDLSGALIVAPVLCMPRACWRDRWGETLALFLTLALLTAVVFGDTGVTAVGQQLQFLYLPVVLWAAFRLAPQIAGVTLLVLGAVAVWATLQGTGPFAGPSPNRSLLLLQAFMTTVALTLLAMVATVRARQSADTRARALQGELEERVASRTAALSVEVQERREAEARLLEAQRVAQVGSWRWDIAANEVWWSDELYRIYGLEPGSFAGSYQGFLDRVTPDDRAHVEAAIARAMAERGSFEFEHGILHPDGGERWVLGRGRVLVDAAGAPVAMAGTAQDITDRRLAERQRGELLREQAARQEAEEANRCKDEFLAVLSHELRTPLHAILGWAALLERGGLDAASRRRAVATIARNGHLQAKLIDDILDISRMTSGRLELQLEDLDAGGLVAAVVETMRPDAEQRGVTLSVQAEPAVGGVRGDGQRLLQVIGNVVGNAVRFARSPGGQVELRMRGAGERVEIAVLDDGPGIPADFLPHLFDRFRQADSSTSRRHGGLGLGLAIARQLLDLHGGTIQAGNRTDGSGAIFTIGLPRVGAASEAAPRALAALPTASPDLAGLRVLVVDDEPDGRVACCRLLEGWGVHVAEAASADEALHRLTGFQPDLVLADLAMPGTDGFEFMVQLRQRQAGHVVPVAALTAHAGDRDRQRVLAAGFMAHLSKPLDADALRRLLAEVIRDSWAGRRS